MATSAPAPQSEQPSRACLSSCWCILLALAVVMYVFQSLGLYTMAKRRGIKCYGLAWVPIGNLWIMGKLADQFDDYKKG